MLDKYDDFSSIYNTGIVCRYFRFFRRVNRSKHGRGADDLNNILGYEGENCYIRSGNGCFLKCSNYTFKKDFTKEYFEFIQS